MPYDKIDQLYDALYADGAVSKDRDYFRGQMLAPGEQGYKNRKQLFDALKADGAVESETYEDFAAKLGMHAGKPERVPEPPVNANEFSQTINDAYQTIGQSQQAERRIDNRQQRIGLDLPKGGYGRLNIGENRKVTKGQQRLNPETGQLEETYITPQGNEYANRGMADIEQNSVDQQEWEQNNPKEALRSRIDRQIADIEARREELTGAGGAPRNVFTNMYAGGQGIPVQRTADDQTLDDLTIALEDLKDARTRMERGEQLHASSDFLGGIGIPFTKDWFNNWKNFGYGVWDTLSDPGLYDFGISDMAKAGMYSRIKRKIDNGEELNDSETALALAGMAKAQTEQMVDVPHGYTAGVTTTDMAPFMLQMAMNPGSGIGKALARKAVRNFGRNGIKAVGARMAGRVVGNAAEAAVLSNTLQAGNTVADIMNRYSGDSFAYDDDGNLKIGYYQEGENGEPEFVEGGKSALRSIYEGEAASIIENFTELGFGGNINAMLSKAAGSKLGQKIGLGYVSDLVGKVGSTPFARSMKKFMERTHWDGMIEEPLEEEYGIVLNAALGTGDAKLSDLWDSEKQADIFAGTMWFGGMMAGMNVAAYPFAKRAMKRNLNIADAQGETAFGDEWPTMKATIDYMDDKKIADFLYGIRDDDNFSPEQKAAMVGYAARLKQYQGANVADMLMRIEGNLSDDEVAIKSAYDEGTDVEAPDEMKAIVDEAEAAGQNLQQYGKEFTAMIANGSADPTGTLDYLMNNRDTYSDEEIAAAADYYQKHARAQGVMDAASDRIDQEVERANAEVVSNTHKQTGNVVMAKGDGDMDYYIIGGDIVTDPDTGMTQLVGTGGAVIVKNAQTGEVSVKSPQEVMMYSSVPADQLIEQNETVLRQQLEQQTDDDITYGTPANEVFDMEDTVTLQDGNGGVTEGQIVTLPNAVDGVFVVQTNDGRALQMTADEMNRRIVTHNGQEVQRAVVPQQQTQQEVPLENPRNNPETSPNSPQNGENSTENAENPQNNAQNPRENSREGEQPQSALSRIPVRTDEKGQPMTNKKGRPILDWHKASVEDAAAALVETTGGDMVMARDTASDLVKQAQAGLEKIRKQKPKGDDPIEIAESRMEIRRQEQEQQAIISQWQHVGDQLRRQMQAESEAKRAAEEAAKSEEQKAREAEEARIRKEKQDAEQAERRRKQVEEEIANWNKPYGPLSKARKEMENDQEATAILNDTEPRTLEEWVSSLIQPQSMMWDDETDPTTGRTVIGLQSELGLQKKDIERIGGLIAPSTKGGKPFGQVVHDIWEALPEGMQNMYDDQDVRNALIGLFGEGNTMRMRHLTEEHRIEEARQLQKENERRDREAEMDAWAEAYHLTPEERDQFEAYLEMPPTEPEQEVINQIIEEYEQSRRSNRLDRRPKNGGVSAEASGGENQVQQAAEAASNGNPEQGIAEGAEASGSEPPIIDDSLSGGSSIFGEPKIDIERSRKVVSDLADAYASGDPAAIQQAADALKAYVDEGGEFEGYYQEKVDDYEGDDPQMLADQYKTHVLLDRYLDDDEDQEYIRTGLKPNMRQQPIGKTSSPEEVAAEEAKVDTNPTEGQKEAGNYQKGHINIDGYDITIENPKGSIRRGTDRNGKEWESEIHNTYGYIRGTEGVDGDHIDVYLSDNPTSGNVFVVDQINPETLEFDEHKVMYGFPDAESAEQAYLSNYEEGWGGLGAITEVSREEFKKWVESSHRKTKPFAEYKSVKKEKPKKEPRQHKRIVSDDKMEELRKKLLAKFNNLNEGIDVERMLLGAMYAVGKIERGVTKFADYAAQMVDEIGDAIRPYLKAFYEAVRNMPEAAEYRDQMTSPEEVAAFDEYNFDKPQKTPNAITKAEQVVKKQKARQQVKKIEKEVNQKIQQGDLFAGDFFGEEAAVTQQQTQQEPVNDQQRQVIEQKGRVIEQEGQVIGKPKLKTAWWSDSNRPQSIDPKDYKTYMTDEAKTYFANFVSEDGKTDFTKWAHPDLAYITAAAWDGVIIPFEELMQIPEYAEAEIRSAKKGSLNVNDQEKQQHAQHLLDAEHGSAVFENGKIKKVNGKEDLSGPVRQEKKAFIVIGRPAGGKSSVFANRLSNENGARIIDSDTVKPWLSGYDEGYGAGYVQKASAAIADEALSIAASQGDNMVIPRIGGESVISKTVIPLREMGYDVQLFYNDVSEDTSIMRAASRFAQEGRYLSLDYLTTIGDKISETFSTFAEKNLGDYYAEREERNSGERSAEQPAAAQEAVLGDRGSNANGDESARSGASGSVSPVVQTEEQLQLGRSAQQGYNPVAGGERIFSYVEWKSNDVAYGEKPKEIWNSKSGKPMPGKEKESNNNNDELHSVRSEQGLSAEPSQVGEGTGQTSGSADRTGAERSPESDRTERSGRERSVEDSALASGAATSNGKDVQPQPKQKPKHNNRRNNVGERGHDYAPTSPKARFNANVEAIKLMRVLMDEGIEAPTKDQMEVLRQYSGWGGLGTFFNDESSAENKILRDLLDDEEYNAATLSIKTAYYTPAYIIDDLWDIAEAMCFEGGNVLEGSAGIGNIIGQMPRKLSSRSNIEAVEIDKISGNILKLLYPDADVHIEGFQDVKIPNGSVDLAITNVPFAADLFVKDKVDKDLSRRFRTLHDFCIAKNIRKLREGGIGIFISTSGTLDKSNDLRQWITDEGQADVVGAFRLNNETFGGAPVTSDIIVVRKRVGGVKSDNAIDISKSSPIRVGSYKDKYDQEHQTSMTVNDYFHDHPEMMAGEMAFGYEKGNTYRPGSYGLYPVEGKSQEKMMKDFVKAMGKAKEVTVTQQQTQQTEPNQLTAVKEGRMLIDDKGRLCVSRYGTAVPLGLNDQKVKGQTKQQCFKDYQDVQKAVDDVLQQQLNSPDDDALKPKLDALNKAFDKFTKRYGTLHKNTSISFLRNDIDFPSFQALENYNETKDMNGKVIVTTTKAPLFTQRVLGFKTEPKPETVKDAVIASIFRSNGIDLDWIAAKLSEVAAPPNGDHWTADDVRKGILVSRLGFEDPTTGSIEIRYKYLSGNVREKLAMAEAYNTDGKYAANVEELRKAVPMDIPSHLIDFSLGSSWIPVELYKEYIEENYGLSNVKLTHTEGNWVLDEGYSYRNEKNRSAGIYSEQFRETIYGHQLVAAALNNRPVKVAKQVSEGYGSSKTTRTVVDKNATQACAVRVDEIKDEFKQWAKKKMQEDPELSARIEKIYNEKFNALVPMEIDDEFLPEHFEGSNTNINLRPHQKRGVIRDLSAPTMLAHEVGTGKSFTLITTAMEMRRLGTARKPMLVVQNATVAQMTADAKLLYPNAKVLSLTEKDRDAEGRRAFYAKIKYNDWDLIIIPQSTFERIPDSPERELQFIQEKIDEKKHVIEAAMQSGMDSREIQRMKKELDKLEMEYGDKYLDSDPANDGNAQKKGKKKDAKKEAAALDKAKTKAREQLDRATDDVQFFDDLGVDALLVDEAHEYKHLGFQTSIGRGIKGIDPSYSKKCAGLYNKTRSVFEKAGWKNVVFATGTPISNTAAEIWTFMKYLMPADVMRANDIYYFDDFVHNFGNISQMLEFATSGKFKENTRFAAYVNKPELIRIWSQVADTVLTKDAKSVQDKLPKKEGGKDQDVFLPQSPSLISIMNAVRAELERYENMTGKEKKENSSIPLTMYGIAKRAAIDPRLVNADAADEPLSKTNAAVKEIVKDLKATDKYKGTVAVFCDNQNRKGPDGSVDFNIYEDMKDKLVKAGVPADQIAIIKSGMSITAKQKIFDAVNAGTIRVVMGSTQTLGTGVNMQERLHLLIHMDAPDRPMDYTQRNGRIERQGNLHKEWDKPIRIVRFGVEDSLDVTAYQRLKTKSGFIDSIMDGKAALANNQVDRTVEEEEEGLFDNPVAVLSGSQYALKKNQAERELRKYQGKKAQWEADQVYVTNTLRRNKTEVEATEANIAKEEQDLKHIRSMFPDGKVKTINVEGVNIDMTKDDGEKKLNEAIKEKINDPVNAIVKRNRENAIYNDETLNYTIKLDGHDVNFTVQVMRESVYEQGRMRTVIHKYVSFNSPDLRLESISGTTSVRERLQEILDEVVTGQDYQDRIDAYKARIVRINEETEQLQKRVGMEFQFDKELEQARKNVEEYTELMKKEMAEKEAKYAAQQKEAKEKGGFDLKKAEESEEDEDVRFSAEEDWDEPVFYSNAQRAVESIRQEKATPEQWLAMIQKNGGLKAGEDKWLGLSDWLSEQADKKRMLTKDDVLDFITALPIVVEEQHYDSKVHEPDYPVRTINKTRELYTTEGLSNLHEIALTVPHIEPYNENDKIHFGDAGGGRAVAWIRFGDAYYNKNGEPTEVDKQWDDFMGKMAEKYGKDRDDTLGLLTSMTDEERETMNKLDKQITEKERRNMGRVLVIDEIQSKRHQDARDKGYKKPNVYSNATVGNFKDSRYEENTKEADIIGENGLVIGTLFHTEDGYSAMTADGTHMTSSRPTKEEALEALDKTTPEGYGVPEAPFEKNWHELAMKRMLRYAAENGYDKIAWTTGEQQAERYDIGKKISRLGISRNLNDPDEYYITYYSKNDPNNIIGAKECEVDDLPRIFGKDLAAKILNAKDYKPDGRGWEDTSIEGNDLRMGAGGMKGFYDDMLPRFMDKYGKKWGVKVGQIDLPDLEKSAQKMWSVDVTPEMKESVMQGQPMFRGVDQFVEGQQFPIIRTAGDSSYNVLGRSYTYSTDLLPDEFTSQQQLLDAVRNQYPDYYATIEAGDAIVMRSWETVMAEAKNVQNARKAKGTESYVERKTRQAINAVTDLANRMNLDVEVLTTTEGLTGKKARSKGWFNPKTHKIVIVLPNNATVSDVINTLLHEGVAHYGLRKMFGQHFDTFLDNVYNNVSPEIKARIDAAIKRNGWSRHEATEEYLARLAEQTDFEHALNSGWWHKIKEFFLDMLAKAGFHTQLSDNELRYILWRSYDNLLHPDSRRNIFDTAKEIQMKTRLKVGDYAERIRIQRTGRVDTSPMVAAAEPQSEAEEYSDAELLHRDDDAWTDDVAQEMYEKAVAQDGIKMKEAWQDSMVALKLIQNAIAKETGKVATGAENAYLFENRMHGRAKNMTEQYDWKYYRPMLKAFSDFIKANGLTQQQGMEYLISKSGLERNVYYAFRDAAKAKLADDIKERRDKLEKDYAKNRITEDEYNIRKDQLQEMERTGVDDIMQQVRDTFAYKHAREEYQNGNISYTEYLRIIEKVISDNMKRKTAKKDAEGHVVSDNYYDDYAKDYSGLTETLAKVWYDDAQAVKKEAQRAIDPQTRRNLWAEYDRLMREAYAEARQVAEDAVFAAENGAAEPQQHTELWEKINAATKETLRQSYESGLMDRNTYNKVRAMFDYYIPLRGWEEDKAADVYTYMGKENVFNPAVKKTWGRTSQAENPLAYIGNIAVSTILSGHRNQMKQHFLNYVMNNPTSLVSISESWYENIAPEGEAPVWVLRTADTAGKSPDEIVTIVNDFNEEMRQKQKEGKAMPVTGRLRLDVHATSGQKAEHVVEVQRTGHTYQLYINGNPKAAQALNGSAARAVSRISDTWLGKKITSLNRSMAMFFTSKNPAFVVSNLSRDLNMAGASVAVNEGKAYNAKFIANVAKVLTPRMGESSKWVPASKQPTGLMPSLMRKWQNGTLDESNETERYFKEFMDEGGETGFVNMLSVDSFKEKMKMEIAEMNGSALFGKGVKETTVHKGLRLLGETFEFYNRCAEDATRFIVYMTSRQMGKTLEESIADAKDVTLNFNRKGTGGMGNAELRDLFIFVNPAIQALANMYRMAKGHPLKFGAVTAAFVAGGVLMPIINQWALNLFGDDDDKQAYWNLPPWVRKNNLVFWLPFTKNFVTIPLAQEFRVFYGVGEMISSAVMDHPIDKWGLELFSSVADLVPINPTGNGGNLMVDFAPTMVQPLMQVGENVDFTGKPIWRENQGNKHAPMYEKAYVTTPQWMIKMSEKVNDLTGGNEGKKGMVEKYAPFWGDYINNPAVWNHLLQGYFGGMYNTIAKTFDVGVTAAKGELPKIYQTPVINRFLNRPVERDNAGALGEEYYNLTEERDALQYELRTWKKKAADGEDGAQEHVDEILESPEYKRAEVVSHYEKIMKDLKAGEKAATESADKADIKESIGMYKQQMMEELDAIGEGKEPLDAAIEAFDNAKTFAEKNKLRMRIERLMMREGGRGTTTNRTKGRAAEVEKALSYASDIEKESRDTNERYLELATAEDIRDDARIKASKAKVKAVSDEYRRIQAERPDRAADFYSKHEKELAAWRILDQQTRVMNQNKKLLGKGSDRNIMKLIANNRRVMLQAAEKIE